MLHWLAILVGGVVTLFLIFYAYLVICSLIENTGSMVFSVAAGVCHAAAPLAFLYFGWQCFLRKLPQCGLPLTLLGAVVCLAVCLAVVMVWEKLVLGDVPETWQMGLITVAQAAITAALIYGFIHI